MVGLCRSSGRRWWACVGVGEEMVGKCRSRGRRWWACVGVGGGDGGLV